MIGKDHVKYSNTVFDSFDEDFPMLSGFWLQISEYQVVGQDFSKDWLIGRWALPLRPYSGFLPHRPSDDRIVGSEFALLALKIFLCVLTMCLREKMKEKDRV